MSSVLRLWFSESFLLYVLCGGDNVDHRFIKQWNWIVFLRFKWFRPIQTWPGEYIYRPSTGTLTFGWPDGRSLLGGVTILCIGFGSSGQITNAYGLAGCSFEMQANDSRYCDVCHNHSAYPGNVLCLGPSVCVPATVCHCLWGDWPCILGMYIWLSELFNDSDNTKISPWGMGSMLYWHRNDLLYESLAS